MHTRKAEIKDLKSITNLAIQLHKQHEKYNGYYKLNDNYMVLIEGYYTKLINDPEAYVIVALDGLSNIIGYAYATIGRRAPYYRDELFGSLGEIFVCEEHRKLGIAKILVRQLFEWFKERNLDYSELEVDANNTAAIRLWEKIGYHLFIHKMFHNLIRK